MEGSETGTSSNPLDNIRAEYTPDKSSSRKLARGREKPVADNPVYQDLANSTFSSANQVSYKTEPAELPELQSVVAKPEFTCW